MDKLRRIETQEAGFIQEIKEGVTLIQDNQRSVSLTLILLIAIIGLYFKSPYYKRQIEEYDRLRKVNSDLSDSVIAGNEVAEGNSKMLEQIQQRLNELEKSVNKSEDYGEDILCQIKELRSDLQSLQNQLLYRINR